MTTQDEILINQFGQNLIFADDIKNKFESQTTVQKKIFLNEIINLINQSKPNNEDIEIAIVESKLKQTYTPCVLIKKGIENYNLKKLVDLPENELNKSLILLLSLFKIAYQRRFQIEKDNPNKWWYWDLSNEELLNKILKLQP